MTPPLADAKANISDNSRIPEAIAEEGHSTNSRRRGRRGGRRDRGERNETQETSADAQNSRTPLPVAQANDDVADRLTALAPEVHAEATEPHALKTAVSPEADPPVIDELVVPQTSVVASETDESLVIAAVESDFETASIEADSAPISVVEPVSAEPSSFVDTTPYVDIEKALETSGLVIVETISDKAKEWQPEMASSEAPSHPRRVRPAAVVTPDEPLIMVETNHQ